MSLTKFDARRAYDPALAFDKEDARIKYYCNKYKPLRDRIVKAKGRTNFMTAGLFSETVGCNFDKNNPPILTFARFDYETYTSILTPYMDICDPSEYIFAIALFGDWHWWKCICDAESCQPFLARMREELQEKLRSRAIQSILEVSNGESSKAFEANKFLSQCVWKDKGEKEKKGRPKKSTKEMTEEEKQAQEDLKRMKAVFNKSEPKVTPIKELPPLDKVIGNESK